MNLEDLKVRRGDPIEPFVKRLLKELPVLFRFFTGRGVRFNRTPNGIIVVADLRSNSWEHPFRVAVSDASISVSNGSVNNLVPQIDGVGIDGLDSSGADVPAPQLKLTGGPNEDLRSWICAQAKVDLKTGLMNPKDEGALTIVHTDSLDPQSADGGFPDDGAGIGLQPLAMLVWDEDGGSVTRVWQITHHNLGHRYVPAKAPKPARHFFWAV